MILITGGAGFIGSHLVSALNRSGEERILLVDNLERSEKIPPLGRLRFLDFEDKRDFRDNLESGRWPYGPVRAILHEGACSDTMEGNGRYLMENNFSFSKALLATALERRIPFLYASSASVYGDGRRGFREEEGCEAPLNGYAFSKWLFDRHVRSLLPSAESPVVGLRYFNIYGGNEAHKGRMASMVHQAWRQLRRDGTVRLFEGTDGYADGEQRRDFVWVEDVVRVNLHFLERGGPSGIYNCGTGAARSFNELVGATIRAAGFGRIEYVPMPEELKGKYQSYTQADPTNLRAAGCSLAFTPMEEAVRATVRSLEAAERGEGVFGVGEAFPEGPAEPGIGR